MTRHSPCNLDAALGALAAIVASPAAHFVLGVIGLSVAALVLSRARP